MADSETRKNLYTYAFLREDGSPYYIGKGSGRRAWRSDNRRAAKRPVNPSRILILKENLTEEEAFRHERYMISVLGRKDLGSGILRNMTDGGEGASGAIRSEELRRKLSELRRGKKPSEETRRTMSESRLGKKNSFFGKRHGEKWRRRQSEKICGERNPNARSFVFTGPSGEDFHVVGGFEIFCRKQGISWQTMRKALRRNCSPPPRNGWLVRKAILQ
jgi:hypothetical protein